MEALLQASRMVGLEVNIRLKNAGQNHNSLTGNKPFENIIR